MRRRRILKSSSFTGCHSVDHDGSKERHPDLCHDRKAVVRNMRESKKGPDSES
jgi:hypothetical protein